MTNDNYINKRPIIEKAIVSAKMTEVEIFQNKTLRPIIKMKHELLLAYFLHFLSLQKIDFQSFIDIKKVEFIELAFSKDSQLRNEIKGMIIGLFTLDEFAIYKNFIKESNIRILTMIKERILNTLIK